MVTSLTGAWVLFHSCQNTKRLANRYNDSNVIKYRLTGEAFIGSRFTRVVRESKLLYPFLLLHQTYSTQQTDRLKNSADICVRVANFYQRVSSLCKMNLPYLLPPSLRCPVCGEFGICWLKDVSSGGRSIRIFYLNKSNKYYITRTFLFLKILLMYSKCKEIGDWQKYYIKQPI